MPQGDPGSKKLMALPVSTKSGGAAATRDGQYKKRGVLPQGYPGSKKFMALPVSIKSGGAAATRDGCIKSGGAAARRSGQYKIDGAAGQYKKRGRCRSEKWSVKKGGALPQRELVSIKSGGSAST